MQVEPSAHTENASRAAVPVLPVQSIMVEAFEPILRQQRSERREARGTDPTTDALSVAAAAPLSTAVINDAERRVETGSRAYERETAQQDGQREFREAREQTHSAARERAEREADGSAKSSKSPSETSPDQATNTKSSAAAAQTAERTISAAGRRDPSAGPVAQDSIGNKGQTTQSGVARQNAALSTTSDIAQTAPRTAGGSIAALTAGGRSIARGVIAATAGRPVVSAGARVESTTVVNRASNTAGTTRSKMSVKTAFSQQAESAERTENLKRIVRVVSQHLRENSSRTVMRIDPPELGSLRLEMNLRGDALTLRIDTSTHLARHLLQEDVEKLRHGLEAAGIHLERVEVRPPPTSPDAPDSPGLSQSQSDGEGQEAFADANAEHSREQGMESHVERTSPETATDLPAMEPAAEPLVNVIA